MLGNFSYSNPTKLYFGDESLRFLNGVTEDMIEGIADSSFIMEGGYKVLTKEEIAEILRRSM